MFSMLKKAVIAIAFVIAFAVAASPVDYLNKDSNIYIYVNTANLLKAKSLQKYISMLDEELKDSGLKARDFSGKAAIGVNLAAKQKEMLCNFDVIVQLNPDVAAKIYNIIEKESDNENKKTVAGKAALEEDELRVMKQQRDILSFQIKADGDLPFTILNKGNNSLKQIKDLEKYDVVVYCNVAETIKKLRSTITEEDKEFFESLETVENICFCGNIDLNGNYKFKLVANCKSEEEAESLFAFVKVVLDLASKESDYKYLIKKIKMKRSGSVITYEATFTGKDIEEIAKLFE